MNFEWGLTWLLAESVYYLNKLTEQGSLLQKFTGDLDTSVIQV